MTVQGGETPAGRAALASCTGNETRGAIVRALRREGPLSAPELRSALGDPDLRLARVAYHLTVLVSEGVLAEAGRRHAGACAEKRYFFAVAA
jgi:hypothetical protein